MRERERERKREKEREREREREREEYHFYLLPKIVHHPKIAFPVSISLQGKISTNETSHMLTL